MYNMYLYLYLKDTDISSLNFLLNFHIHVSTVNGGKVFDPKIKRERDSDIQRLNVLLIQKHGKGLIRVSD